MRIESGTISRVPHEMWGVCLVFMYDCVCEHVCVYACVMHATFGNHLAFFVKVECDEKKTLVVETRKCRATYLTTVYLERYACPS